MSMGYLVGGNITRQNGGDESTSATNSAPAPIVWRGLMLTQALHQLLHSVAWPALDILVLDLPPGTGDVQLTVTQRLIVDGAVIVSTPQHLSTIDAARGLAMFNKVDVPVLGVIQNMSAFVCPSCGTTTRIFGGETNTEKYCDTDGGVAQTEEHMHSPWPKSHPLSTVPFLGDIPLDPTICEDADAGKPTVVARPESSGARVYSSIARKVADMMNILETKPKNAE